MMYRSGYLRIGADEGLSPPNKDFIAPDDGFISLARDLTAPDDNLISPNKDFIAPDDSFISLAKVCTALDLRTVATLEHVDSRMESTAFFGLNGRWQPRNSV